MQVESIRNAVSLGESLQQVFIATADSDGLPHVTVASKISLASEDQVTVSAWFCPGTVMNLQVNRHVALVIWDATTDNGYQLLGEVKTVEEQAMMDGYSPEMESLKPSPQVERSLLVHVNKVIGFSHAPHSDLED